MDRKALLGSLLMNGIVQSKGFRARRDAARRRLDAINPHLTPGGDPADPSRIGWFRHVYEAAAGDTANVPWARLAASPLLKDWIDLAGDLRGLRALDVGCGLGDNAEILAKAGAEVTAFDYVPRAIEWARERFPQSRVDYRAADLFRPPGEWGHAFNLVHESATLQTLPPERLPEAARRLASFLAPGGQLLVIASARDAGEPQTTPWLPLTRADIEALAVDGLRLERLELHRSENPSVGRHWRACLLGPAERKAASP